MAKKREIKTMHFVIALMVLLLLTFTVNIYNNSAEDEVVVGQTDSIGALPFSSIDAPLNDKTFDGQAFVFLGTDELKDEQYTNYVPYWTGTDGEGLSDVFVKEVDANVKAGYDCPSGTAIRFLYCEANWFSEGFTCEDGMFNDMWYKSNKDDVLDFTKYSFTNDKKFYYAYVCYEYKEGTPEYNEKVVLFDNICYLKDSVVSVLDQSTIYKTGAECSANVIGTTEPPEETTPTQPDNTDNPYSNQRIGDNGYFTNVKWEKSIEQYDSTIVTADFIVTGDHSKVLLEAHIDPNTRGLQAQSIITSTSQFSACDQSRYFVGKVHKDVKDGDVIKVSYTLLTPHKTGDYILNLISTDGCYSDIGWDSSGTSVDFSTTVTTKTFDSTDDVDGDGITNDIDICKYVFGTNNNLDTDGDFIGDYCDYCPLDKGLSLSSGLVTKNGCHPCEGLAEADSCWDEDYSKYELSDPRYVEGENPTGEGEDTNEQIFLDYLEELKERALIQQEQDCIARGDIWEDESCVLKELTCQEAIVTNEFKTIDVACSDDLRDEWFTTVYCPSNPSNIVCQDMYCVNNPDATVCGGEEDVCDIDPSNSICETDEKTFCELNPTAEECGGSGALSCVSGDYRTLVCEDGKEITSQVCDTKTGNFVAVASCDDDGDGVIAVITDSDNLVRNIIVGVSVIGGILGFMFLI